MRLVRHFFCACLPRMITTYYDFVPFGENTTLTQATHRHQHTQLEAHIESDPLVRLVVKECMMPARCVDPRDGL